MWCVINAIFVILKCVKIPHFCPKFWSFFSYIFKGLSYESIKRLIMKILCSTTEDYGIKNPRFNQHEEKITKKNLLNHNIKKSPKKYKSKLEQNKKKNMFN